MTEKIKIIREKLKKTSPLIHCITNPISINQCANLILAVGCRPVMVEHPEEVGEITATANALLLNIGNITDVRLKSIIISAKTAKEKEIPLVFDAVGVACSTLRKNFAQKLLQNHTPNVIKGNYSEINALYDSTYKTAGVDADTSLEVSAVAAVAARLALKCGSIVLASGKTDIITDGNTVIYVKNGTQQLAKITGTGCMLGALASCYAAAECNIYSIASACAVFGICGELAQTDKGTGTFSVNLMDRLSTVLDENIEKLIKAEVKDIEKI